MVEYKTEADLRKEDPIETFERPIPGSSLTSEEGLYPFEGPQEYTDPEDVIEYYSEKLSDPRIVDNVMLLLELGFPISTLAKTMLTTAQMAGLHSIDISLILTKQNVLTQMLKDIGDEAGINYTTGDEPDEKEVKAKRDEVLSALIRKALKEEERSGIDEGTELMRDSLEMLDDPVERLNPGFSEPPTPPSEGFDTPDFLKPREEEEERKKGFGADYAMGDEAPAKGLMSRRIM